MNYATIKWTDIANGEGVRISLFVSGCTHHCKNCFNEVAWDFTYGNPFDEAVEQKILNEYIKQIQTTTPPPVISATSGGNIAFSKQKQPLSLSEAKSLVEEIFNTKGD